MKRKPTEHETQSVILDWLKAKRIFYWRSNVGAMKGSHKGKSWFVRFGPVGGPDIFCVINGQLIGIEVKAFGKYQSQEQVFFETALTKSGGKYIMAWDLSDVTKVLEEGQ